MIKNINILRKLHGFCMKMSAPYVKLDTPLSDLAVVCRGCLADCGQMKDIREWGLIEDFRKYAGIQLRRSDGISELLCTICEDSLLKCKQFEQQCRQSDVTLKNYTKVQPKTANINNISFEFNNTNLIFTIEAPDLDSNINLPCPYKCKETYSKRNDLLNHLIRFHQHQKDYSIEYRYHCWEQKCPYNKQLSNFKYFTERKYINQHYNKVHRTKIFHCDTCGSDFATTAEFNRHHSSCNVVFRCEDCSKEYSSHDRLLVHLMRRHPEKHKEYKAKKAEKRKAANQTAPKKPKIKVESLFESDSPKRSFATQTNANSIKNDIALPSWQNANEISTQTGFEDLLSIKSNSEDDSLFYSETTLSDIHTQTFPLEFGLVVNRSHKETLTESLDISIKGTQTCFCYCDSPKLQFGALESVTSSPRSGNLTSTETQTADNDLSDVLLSLNSTETQTCFDEAFKESL